MEVIRTCKCGYQQIVVASGPRGTVRESMVCERCKPKPSKEAAKLLANPRKRP